ncbi:MAG: hypothetical protein OXJ90_20270 [Spirochaetaceae bacterium]|nr:hypothetical protein [Spirochaetaceae bacterium]
MARAVACYALQLHRAAPALVSGDFGCSQGTVVDVDGGFNQLRL